MVEPTLAGEREHEPVAVLALAGEEHHLVAPDRLERVRIDLDDEDGPFADGRATTDAGSYGGPRS